MSPCSGHWTPGWQPAHLRWTRFCSWQFLPHMAAVALWRGHGEQNANILWLLLYLRFMTQLAACPWPETGYTFIHDTPLPRINFTMLCAENVQKVTSANCWKYLRFSTGPISIPSPDCYLVLAAVLAVVVSGSDCEAGHYHCGAQWRWQTGHCAAPLWTLWPHYGHTALYYGQSMDSSDPFIRATPLPSHCGSLMTAHSHLATSARSCSSAID